MYIKKKLFEAINELYYREFQSTVLKPLPKNFTIYDVEVMKGLSIEISLDMLFLLEDLQLTLENHEPKHSNLGKDLLNYIKQTSEIFNNRMQDLSDTLVEVMSILKYFSKESCLVGGCVRDTILGKNPKDFDFVTDIPYDQLVWMFTEKGFIIKETGKQFLVLNVIKNSEEFEIANFRKDGTYIDGRRPEAVEIGTIYDDAQRRDFTVNALYFNLNTKTIIDPTGLGLDDIGSEVLRFIGKPEERLAEDSLRAYRFYRFIGRGFKADSRSLRAVRTQFANDNNKIKRLQELGINITDFERIRNEIEKMVNL